MLRVLFWATSAVGLGWLCWHFAAWRVAAQVGLVWVFLLWVVLGGWLVSRSLSAEKKRRQPSASELEGLRALAFRQEYAGKYGEVKASEVEKFNPTVWRDHIRRGTHLP